ncbi:MAG: glycosyl transferase family 2 [Bdellovibrionales bacterium RBG_16_40_8]|nr:MAG: glycosyl transferase family 2 [Bdellovibrionales bacterium RBG_16_40_8]
MMIVVIIPCYKVKNKILSVIDKIGPEVDRVIVVDDACPENSGDYVKEHCRQSRVSVLSHKVNKGVGGAVITGYKEAIKLNADVVVKIDGDGQLDPRLLTNFVRPIISGESDFVKGNRFYSWEMISSMPRVRFFGNSALSFISKLVSGYWTIMDPTNGYTAISGAVLQKMPLDKLDNRYFFETDMLFRLGTVRAKVIDIPMMAVYADEKSSLSSLQAALTFPPKFFIRLVKRIVYNYFLRDFNLGSAYIISGIFLIGFGLSFGIWHWVHSVQLASSSGTVMLAALPIILGYQSLVQFITYDVLMEPKTPIHQYLKIYQS